MLRYIMYLQRDFKGYHINLKNANCYEKYLGNKK